MSEKFVVRIKYKLLCRYPEQSWGFSYHLGCVSNIYFRIIEGGQICCEHFLACFPPLSFMMVFDDLELNVCTLWKSSIYFVVSFMAFKLSLWPSKN